MNVEAALESFRGPNGVALTRLESGAQVPRGDRGGYALVVDLKRPASLEIGRLGTVTFAAGRYVYCGSALGGLGARIARHRRAEKRFHWHVDFLLGIGTVAEVWVAVSPVRLECLLAKHLGQYSAASRPAAGFGSSDCRCPSHLLRWSDSD